MPTAIRSLLNDIKSAGLLHRAGTLVRAKREDGTESEDTFTLSFSSEEPYERYFGMEVLGHKKSEVRLDWLKAGSAPLLLEHDREHVIGVIEEAKIEGGRGTATVRFGKSALAREILADVAAGIRKNVSVGYEVHDMVMVKQGKEGPSEYRVTDWKPLEVSIVSLPADETVGVGRSHNPHPDRKDLTNMNPTETETPAAPATKAAAPIVNITDARSAIEGERARIKAISEIANRHGLTELAAKHIEGDTTADAFSRLALDEIAKRSNAQGGVFTGQALPKQSKGERRDLRRFSLVRAVNLHIANKPLDGIEAEMHAEACRQNHDIGLEVRGLGVPMMVFTRADLTVADDGANLVQTDVSGDVIPALRNKLVMARLGARLLTGLRGSVTLPKVSAGASATWEGETDAGAESEPTTGKVSLSPKRLGLYSDISKQLLMQSSPDVELMLMNDIMLACAHGLDKAAIDGSGSSGQPTGILATSGIGDVAGGTNGLAPTWAHMIELETDVANANAPDNALGYLTNSKVRGKLKGTVRVGSTDSRFIWDGGDFPLNGYKCEVTNAVPSNLNKGSSSGVCSAIIFGNFTDLVIGQWGGLDLVVDPYTQATSGLVRMVANIYADVGVRYAASFSAMQDALTT